MGESGGESISQSGGAPWQALMPVEQLQDGVVTAKGAVVVLRQGERLYACGSRCPHMGYPMAKGVVRDGVITCAWHRWEFDLDSGACYRGACDDLPVYPVRITDGTVEVLLTTPAVDIAAEERRLIDAMMTGDNFLQARAVSGLLKAGVAVDRIAQVAWRQSFAHAIINHRSMQAVNEAMAIAIGADLARESSGIDAVTRLLHGVQTAGGSSGERPRIDPLPEPALSSESAPRLLRRYVTDSSPLGIERILRSWPQASDPAAALVRCAMDPIFIDQRNVLIGVTHLLAIRERSGDDWWQAEMAWILGNPRGDLQPDARDALNWCAAHAQQRAVGLPQHGADTDVSSIASAINASSIETVFNNILALRDNGVGFLQLLNTLTVLLSRRIDHLRPNNGGLWNSAATSLRLARAIRRAAPHLDQAGRLQAILLVSFDAFVTRWLHPGTTPDTPSEVQDPERFATAFQSNDLAGARLQARALAHHGAVDAVLGPLLAEDLSIAQLDTLAAAIDCHRDGLPESHQLFSAITTWIQDTRSQQTTRAAAKFGWGYAC